VSGFLYRVLADALVVFHLSFIVFTTAGVLLAFRSRRLVWFHLPCVAWGVLVELTGWICPLTPIENALRSKAGLAGFSGGFIDHYLIPVVYPPGLTRAIQIAAGVLVLVANVVGYALLWRLGPRVRAKPPARDVI